MLQFLYSLWISSKKGLKFNMKRQTPQQTLEIYKSGITDSIQRWKFLDTHGGSDPFWSDGCNMNLVRNHILYYRRQLELLCESENGDCLLSIIFHFLQSFRIPIWQIKNKKNGFKNWLHTIGCSPLKK